MGTITIGRGGVEFVHTNVLIPRHLRDLAKKLGVSMSKELRTALEEKIKEGSAQGPIASNTVALTPLSRARDEVDE